MCILIKSSKGKARALKPRCQGLPLGCSGKFWREKEAHLSWRLSNTLSITGSYFAAAWKERGLPLESANCTKACLVHLSELGISINFRVSAL